MGNVRTLHATYTPVNNGKHPLVSYPFPLSPEAGYSVSKGSVEKVDPCRQKLSVVLAVSVALGSLLAPLGGEKHWNRAEYRFKKKFLLKNYILWSF